MCHIQILKPQLAVADLKKVLALEPQNAQVRKELESTQKLVRKIEFEKAIEVEEEKNAVERCLEIIAEGALCQNSTFAPKLKFSVKGPVRWKKPMKGQNSRQRMMENSRSL